MRTASFAVLGSLAVGALLSAAVSACSGQVSQSTPSIHADTASGQACLAYLNGNCASDVNSCNGDPSCVSFTNGCLNQQPPGLGAYECMSSSSDSHAGALFLCMEGSPACNQPGTVQPVPDGGDGGDGSEGGQTCATPLQPTTFLGKACLSQMQTTCPSAVAACNTDCDCVSFVDKCLDGTDPAGAAECLSAAHTHHQSDISDCSDILTSCLQAQDAGVPPQDAGAGG
jgi:hypothetical protein